MNVCDKDTMGNSVPSCSCESCAPHALSEASVYTIYFYWGLGNVV